MICFAFVRILLLNQFLSHQLPNCHCAVFRLVHTNIFILFSFAVWHLFQRASKLLSSNNSSYSYLLLTLINNLKSHSHLNHKKCVREGNVLLIFDILICSSVQERGHVQKMTCQRYSSTQVSVCTYYCYCWTSSLSEERHFMFTSHSINLLCWYQPRKIWGQRLV